METKRTTIKKRLLRLACISVVVASFISTTAAEIGILSLANTNTKKTGATEVAIAEKMFNEEILYLTECLLEADTTLEGDSTFEKVFYHSKENASNFYPFEGYDYSEVKGIIESANTEYVVVTPYVTNDEGVDATLIAIKNENGIKIGELTSDYFDAVLSILKLNETDAGFIVDANGNAILSSNYDVNSKANNIGELYGLTNISQNIACTETANSKAVFNDIKLTFTQTPVSKYGYAVVYGTDTSEAFNQAIIICAVLASVCLILFGLSWWVANTVGNQISKSIVTTTMRLVDVSKGDLYGEVPAVTRGDETQLLNEAMIATINEFSAYIKDIENFLSELSQGNLNVTTEMEYVGDFVKIKEALEKIKSDLTATIASIKEVSEQVAYGSVSLSSSAQLLAENTSEEAATLEEISSMTNDIETNVGKNTGATIEAHDLLKMVVDVVETGSSKMADMKNAMDQIQESSEQIEKIVKMIDDIAFQTNILSLNAAVEAARAGAAGKGFAVVADEVRNLAGKSADAVKSTMELVETSSRAVRLGGELTKQTDDSLKEIHTSVGQFANLMDSITDASKEQEGAIKQITLGIEQLANAVQSNSATAEESSSSTIELTNLANQLKDEIEHFTV